MSSSFFHGSRKSLLPSPRRAFTLVELLVVIAIVALLAALIVPAVGRSMSRSRFTSCGHHMRQAALMLQHDELHGALQESPRSKAPSEPAPGGGVQPAYPVGCPYCNPPWTPKIGEPPVQTEVVAVTNDLIWKINTETYCPEAIRSPVTGYGLAERQSFGVSAKFLKQTTTKEDWILTDSDVEVVSTLSEVAFERHKGRVNIALRDGAVIPALHTEISDPAR